MRQGNPASMRTSSGPETRVSEIAHPSFSTRGRAPERPATRCARAPTPGDADVLLARNAFSMNTQSARCRGKIMGHIKRQVIDGNEVWAGERVSKDLQRVCEVRQKQGRANESRPCSHVQQEPASAAPEAASRLLFAWLGRSETAEESKPAKWYRAISARFPRPAHYTHTATHARLYEKSGTRSPG